jgi:hypothetical protein
MKITKSLPANKPALLFLLGCLTFNISAVIAQSTPPTAPQDKQAAKKALIKSLIDSQRYVFQAQTAMSMGGHVRQLTTDYDVTVGKESVVSYLPYFGRAYSAPIDPSQGGIQFTSKDFSYSAVPGKKGGWSVLIKLRDAGDVQQMSLNISDEGYTTLQVINVSKQPISFNGVIVPRKPKRR